MFRNVFVAILVVATLSGCSWMRKALNPSITAEFQITIETDVEHRHLAQINGTTQSFMLSPPPPGSLSHTYNVEIEVKDLDYFGSDGNQDRPYEAVISVSLFDLDTGLQSRPIKKDNAKKGQINHFFFTDTHFH